MNTTPPFLSLFHSPPSLPLPLSVIPSLYACSLTPQATSTHTHTHSESSWRLRQVNPIFPQREGLALSIFPPRRGEKRRWEKKKRKGKDLSKNYLQKKQSILSIRPAHICLLESPPDPVELLNLKVHPVSHPHQWHAECANREDTR